VKRHGSAPELPAIPVGEEAEPVVAAPTSSTGARWTRVLAVGFGLVATVALVVIAWGQLEQERLLRHQQCINDAQIQFGAAGPPNQGDLERALARCYANPKAFLANQPPVVLPGFVSVHLGDAKKDISAAGLVVGAIHGPTGDDSLITDQQPKGGLSVPAGTSVDLWTTAA
jgi:hypothetical protein